MHNQRYCVLNPYDGTFKRFKSREDYPRDLKYLFSFYFSIGILYLSDIYKIYFIKNNELIWYMKKNIFYF